MSDPFTGCPPVSDTVRVTYDSLHFTPNYTSPTNLLYLCPGDSILIDPASGASSYQWFGPGGPFTTPTITVDTVGTWSVNVTDCAGNVSVYGFLTQFGSGFVPNYAPVNIFYPCYGDTTVLTFNGGALSYTWSNGVPGPTNIISTADTFYCLVDHCVSVDTFEFRFEPLYCDSVWPGDASYDGIANMYDLLNLGVAFGSAGPPRTDQSIGWYAHDAVDWANSFANIGRNFKHADCDGDGVVDYPDTTAIVQNYGQVHTVNPLMGLGGPNDPPLYFSSIPPQIEEGSAVTIPVYLGSSALPMNDFYGGAFSINYDTNFVKPNSVHITFSPSWVGSLGTTAVAISKNLPMEQRIDLAIARTDHQPISGYGEIAQLHIIMQDDISAVTNEQLLLLGAMMTLSFDNEKFINAQEEEIIVSPLPVDISVLAGVEENEEDHFSLYPNPADEYITIQSPGTTLQKIEIIDLQGRTLLVQNTSSALAILNIAGLEPGVYMVRCGLQNGATGLRRLIVR
jgi:hypothetical protein